MHCGKIDLRNLTALKTQNIFASLCNKNMIWRGKRQEMKWVNFYVDCCQIAAHNHEINARFQRRLILQ